MSELAAKWLRVSSTGQDEQNQEPDEDNWIDSHGYTLALAAGDHGVYRLHGKSASKGRHQAVLDAAIADMKAGKYTVLVVWQSSRIERRGAWSVFDLFRRVHEAGGRIEFVQDAYLNESNEMSDVMLALAATKDRQKSRDIQKQTRAGHAKIDAAEALRTKPPFGYVIEGEKYAKALVPTKEGRKLVPAIFEKIADGESCQSAALWLEAQTGRRAWPKFIAMLIRQTAYYGDLKFQHAEIDDKGKPKVDENGEPITVERVHHCDPLVSFYLWDRANKRLDVVPRRGRSVNSPHLFKGVAVCGVCGGTLVRTDGNHRGKVQTWWLRCIGTPDAKSKRRCSSSPAVMVPYADVTATVTEIVEVMADDWPVVTRTMVHGRNWDSEIRLTQRRLAELHKQVAFDDPAYLTRQGELLAELADYKARPAEPDRWAEEPTGKSHLDLWHDCTTDAQRNAFLTEHRYSIRLWKDRLDLHTAKDIPGGTYTNSVQDYPLVRVRVPRKRGPRPKAVTAA
jgi:DNA invertase Pin-like site-specific DNA recombinase